MEIDETQLRDWPGRTETVGDVIALDRCLAMQATLDRPDPPLREGDPLPPLWHWLYFWTVVPRSALGRDGHPALGGFLPPLGTARRMWAGSRVQFLRPLPIGGPAERISTVSDVSTKQGRTGQLVFVTVRHEISVPDGLAIIDEHDIVYRDGDGRNPRGRSGTQVPSDPAFSETVNFDSTLLFRYSALTFNGHRIHYDRDYATGTEGYAGLVVHGPLLATLLVDLAVRSWGSRAIGRFKFRAHRPIIDTESATLCGSPKDNVLDLWVADGQGTVALTAQAEFKAE